MIDVQPYIERLLALDDYMWYWICWKECQRRILEIYWETGNLVYSPETFQPFCVWLYYHGHNYNTEDYTQNT